jgi:ASC-1-like (ASCH) protein
MSERGHARRLFVPLATQPYRWFEGGLKRWEVRRHGRQYTEKHVVPGRPVELRRGYSHREDSLWGTIVCVVEARDLRRFFERVPFDEVVPTARTREEAIGVAAAILGLPPDEGRVLGFEVALNVMPAIPVSQEYHSLVLSGRKRSTVRLGHRQLRTGPARLSFGSDSVPITITDVVQCQGTDLTEEHARRDGFSSVQELWGALRRFYPDIAPGDAVTVISFDLAAAPVQ